MYTSFRNFKAQLQFIVAVVLAVLVSGGLLAYGAHRTHSLQFSYLLWNLFLAIIPLLFAARLTKVLKYKRWSAWEPIMWTLLWLLFLPNSFYMISDYIHLRDVLASNILYDAVVFTSFIFTAVLLGFSSLYLMHVQLRKRLRPAPAAAWIAVILLSCSFAIYIGRDLRWNSWDIIFNPGGLLFDISDRLLRPEAYSDMFVTVFSFFVLLAGLYGILWTQARLLRRAGGREALDQLREHGRS